VNFPGALPTEATRLGNAPTRRRPIGYDLRNDATASDTQFGGTLVITSGGDYALQGGYDLLRKLIFRRLTSATGAFFHLPKYGAGLRVKEPPSASGLGQMKRLVEDQVRQEREVKSVSAQVSWSPVTGVLMVVLNIVSTLSAEPLSMAYRAGPSATTF